jgi:ankyrin repeat protein
VSQEPGDPAARAELLVRTACSSDVEQARALLDADPGLSRHDLACACVVGDPAEVRRRLADSPRLARGPVGPLQRDAILYCCFSRLLRAGPARAAAIRECVSVLLAAGADPSAEFAHDGWRQTALYGAAGIANDAELTAILIAAGANPNDDGPDHSVGEALYHAVEFADCTCARMLVDAGTHDWVVHYCLGRALNYERPAMVAMLCARGARPSAAQLAQAVWCRRPAETVATLLDAGAPVEGEGGGDPAAPTALQLAVRWGCDELAQLLTARGADPARVTDHDRALGARLRPSAVSPALGAVEAGAVQAGPAELDQMLRLAIQQGDLDATRTLLDLGAPADGNPGDEFTPLGEAAWRGRAAIVDELVSRGAALAFAGGGTAVGAALHGSVNCADPEGGPSMIPHDEIPREPYAAVIRTLLAAGAPVPERIDSTGPPATVLLARLGVHPPS